MFERDRFTGWLVVAAGLLAALVVRLASPIRQPPLYDGIVVVEPYLWLDPPPGLPGGATGATADVAVTAGRNELLAAATAETPPQAQVLGVAGSLVLASDATRVSLKIQPIPAPASPDTGYIDGNVYQFDLTDQRGRAIAARSDALVTIILRPADPGVQGATIAHFDGTRWDDLATTDDGMAGFEAIVTDFGDFAVVAAGTSPYPSSNVATSVAPSITPTPATFPSGTPSVASPAPRPGIPSPLDSGPIWVALLAAVGLIGGALYLARKGGRYSGPRGWGPHGG